MTITPDRDLAWALMNLSHNFFQWDHQSPGINPRTVLALKNRAGTYIDTETGWALDRDTISGFPWYRTDALVSTSSTIWLAYFVIRKGSRSALVFMSFYTNYNQLKYSVATPDLSAGKVHPTFAKILRRYKGKVADTITAFLPTVDDVIFAGYSHAGTVAEILFLNAREQGVVGTTPTHCFTYSSPKLGDEGVASALTEAPNYWNIVPDLKVSEMSPNMPPNSFGYAQTGKHIVWRTGQVCAGDTTVSTGGDVYLTYVCLFFVSVVLCVFSIVWVGLDVFYFKSYSYLALALTSLVTLASIPIFVWGDGLIPYKKYHGGRGPGYQAWDIMESLRDGSFVFNDYQEACTPKYSDEDMLVFSLIALLGFGGISTVCSQIEGGNILHVYFYMMALSITSVPIVYALTPS